MNGSPKKISKNPFFDTFKHFQKRSVYQFGFERERERNTVAGKGVGVICIRQNIFTFKKLFPTDTTIFVTKQKC